MRIATVTMVTIRNTNVRIHNQTIPLAMVSQARRVRRELNSILTPSHLHQPLLSLRARRRVHPRALLTRRLRMPRPLLLVLLPTVRMAPLTIVHMERTVLTEATLVHLRSRLLLLQRLDTVSPTRVPRRLRRPAAFATSLCSGLPLIYRKATFRVISAHLESSPSCRFP